MREALRPRHQSTAIPIALAILLAPGAGLGAQMSQPAPDTAALAAAIPHLLEVGDVPGLSIALVHQGKVSWTDAFGTLGDTARTPVDEETIFSAASLSKPVFAYIVLRLAERGEIDLDRPLAELLEYPRVVHDERGLRITPRMVLSHGTGLPNWGGERLELQFEPGTGFNYSGEGFVYLQRMVEQVTGMSLEELARREVFEPLGMRRTSYIWQDRFEGNAVHGKDWAWRIEHVERYEEPNAAFSLLTTAGDYGRFMAAVVNGTGLTAESVEAMLAPERPARRPSRPTPGDDWISWGLGWGLQEGEAGRAFWHWGDNGRFKAYVVAYPKLGSGVVYLANGSDGLSIAEAIVSRVVEDDHWALQWLSYTRHDDPERRIAKAVQAAAMAYGEEAAVARYHEIRLEGNVRLGVGTSLALARFLNEHDFDEARQDVLGLAARDHPDSIRVQRALAEARLEAGRYEASLAAQRRALVLSSDDEDERRRVRWIEERIAAFEDARPVDPTLLERYVGAYGPRRVWLENGELRYQREGNRAYRLIPMSEDMFALDGLETFRVRFLGEPPGPATAIEGLYFDGTTDRSERSTPSEAGSPPPNVAILVYDSVQVIDHGEPWANVVRLNMEYEPIPESLRVPRSELADLQLPGSLYARFPWRDAEMLEYGGDRDEWTMRWRFAVPSSTTALVEAFREDLETSDGWTLRDERLGGAGWDADWHRETDGVHWELHTKLSRGAAGLHDLTVRVQRARAGISEWLERSPILQ